MSLPKPDDYRRYKLSDGSIIYPSGRDYARDGVRVEMPDKGMWFLWVKDSDDIHGRPTGHVAMSRDSIKYFMTPIEAFEHLQSEEHTWTIAEELKG